ncbi:uncharacterized protein LOC117104643 [Anneissia japonica]|uniref:uncharacterized protein LOC117104643 n=1 Tax=Anneissia japonica TaxID=1529436 RepID=UPI0014257BFE|nr:uncharacterized protein LOC117104643 [Anneissia japonica]XP_033101415.1 uncharacterized protein LOC117104643 [Anneissia japonica]
MKAIILSVWCLLTVIVFTVSIDALKASLVAENITKSSANIKLSSLQTDANDTDNGADDDFATYRIVAHELTADGIPVAVDELEIGVNATDAIDRIKVDDLKSFTHYNVCIENGNTDDRLSGARGANMISTKCVHFQTSYDPWNMEAIAAIAFCGFIITTFLIASVCDMCVKTTPESEADERRFLVQKLIKERRRTNQAYGTENVFEFSDNEDESGDEKMTEEDHALQAMMNFRHEDEICASAAAN